MALRKTGLTNKTDNKKPINTFVRLFEKHQPDFNI